MGRPARLGCLGGAGSIDVPSIDVPPKGRRPRRAWARAHRRERFPVQKTKRRTLHFKTLDRSTRNLVSNSHRRRVRVLPRGRSGVDREGEPADRRVELSGSGGPAESGGRRRRVAGGARQRMVPMWRRAALAPPSDWWSAPFSGPTSGSRSGLPIPLAGRRRSVETTLRVAGRQRAPPILARFWHVRRQLAAKRRPPHPVAAAPRSTRRFRPAPEPIQDQGDPQVNRRISLGGLATLAPGAAGGSRT
jgi:hypothetical protein